MNKWIIDIFLIERMWEVLKMELLKGKTAVLTGAAGGIGASTAMTFAENGAVGIVIADMAEEKAAETCEKIRNKTGIKCVAVKTNIASNNDIEALFSRVQNEFETLDILVNCAGVCPTDSIEEIDEEKWDRVMAINLKGTYLCSRKALMIMKPKKYGKIISVSSISGRVGGIATGINYVTSKGGIIAMTKGLAKAAGPFGININAVAPGFVNTDMAKQFTHFKAEDVPLRRIAEPEDVADVIVFLASNMSRYITGCTLDVTGGVYMS